MKFEEFKNRIEQIYRGKFNKSYCGCKIYSCLGKSITIDLRLAENASECPNNITGNDMMDICLAIRLPDGWKEGDELPENMTLEAWKNGIKVKSTEKYLYCDYKKASYRKTSGDAEKLIVAFGKYVERLYNLVKAEYEAENLLDFPMALVERKGVF